MRLVFLLRRVNRAWKSGMSTKIRLENRRRAAKSSSSGRLVAPITRTWAFEFVWTPSNPARNSVFSLNEASFWSLFRSLNNESISSEIRVHSKCPYYYWYKQPEVWSMLTDENDGRSPFGRHFKESLHHLLTLTHVLGGQRGCCDGKEHSLGFRG